jgi:predicted DNA-binding transcriptional regulator AlpA
MSVQMSVANRYTRRRVQPDLWFSLVHLGTPSLENLITQGNKMQQLLRISDVQRRLAVSRSTTYRFIRAHNIPVVYVLGAPRIRAVDIDNVLLPKKEV